jgi:hypothetical protein
MGQTQGAKVRSSRHFCTPTMPRPRQAQTSSLPGTHGREASDVTATSDVLAASEPPTSMIEPSPKSGLVDASSAAVVFGSEEHATIKTAATSHGIVRIAVDILPPDGVASAQPWPPIESNSGMDRFEPYRCFWHTMPRAAFSDKRYR